jgi:hypothetical protein
VLHLPMLRSLRLEKRHIIHPCKMTSSAAAAPTGHSHQLFKRATCQLQQTPCLWHNR